MPNILNTPDPEFLIATHAETGAKLYANLAKCPLFVDVTLLFEPGALHDHAALPIGPALRCIRFGWLIEKKRFARNYRAGLLADPFLAWMAEEVAATYPSVQDALGYTDAEVAVLRAEYDAKRAAKKAARKKA